MSMQAEELALAIALGVGAGLLLYRGLLAVFNSLVEAVVWINGSWKGRALGLPVEQTPKGEVEGEVMGLFQGMESAQVGQGGIYFTPGKYLVEVVKCFCLRSRKREDLFIVEFLIHESDSPDRGVGTKASWVVNFKQDAALGNIKGFLAACNGIDPDNTEMVTAEITEEVSEYAVDEEENPLAGTKVRLVAVNKKLKDGVSDFTLHLWSPLEAVAA